MSDWVMILTSPVLVAIVLGMARAAALDLDRRGQPGWVYGILILVLFPFGVLAWAEGHRRHPLAPGPPAVTSTAEAGS